MGRSQRRRVFLRALALAALVMVVCLVAAFLALRFHGVRQEILTRGSAWVERRFDVVVSLEDFALKGLAREVELTNLQVAAPGRSTFLAIEAVDVALDRGSILVGRPAFHRVELIRPRLDLAALPPPSPTVDRDPPSIPDIGQFVIRGAGVEGLREVLDQAWLETAEIRDLDLSGSLESGDFQLEIEQGGATFDAIHLTSQEFELAGLIEGNLNGALELDEVHLSSEALNLTISGRGAALGQLAGTADLAADMDRLLGDPSPGANWSLATTFDLASRSADVNVTVNGQKAERLLSLFENDGARPFDLAGVDLDFEASIPVRDNQSELGLIEVAVRKGGRPVLAVTVRPRLDFGQRDAELRLDGEFYPGRIGRRTVSVRVVVPDWTVASSGRVEEGTLVFEVPDVKAELEVLRRDWPKSLGAVPDSPIAGPVEIEARASGPFEDLALEADARWMPAEGGRLSGHAKAQSASRKASGTISLSNLPVRALAEDMAGTLQGSSNWAIDRTGWQADFEVRGEDFGRGQEALFESVDLQGRAADGTLNWNLEGTSPDYGRLAGSGSVGLSSPVREATATLKLEDGPELFSEATVEARLSGGVLSFETVEPAKVLGSEARLEGSIPLANLADAVPELASLPFVQADGEATFEATLDRTDWRRFLPDEFLGGRILGATAAARLAFEGRLAAPTRARIECDLDAVELATERGRLTAVGPLRLRSEGGHGRIEPWSLTNSAATLSTQATFELEEGWTPSESIDRLLQSASGRVEADLEGWRFQDVQGLELPFDFREGRLEIREGQVSLSDAEIKVAVSAPVSSESGNQRASLEFQLPERDWLATIEELVEAEGVESVVGSGRGRLSFVPNDPLAAEGQLTIDRLSIGHGHTALVGGPSGASETPLGPNTRLVEPLQIEVGGHRVRVPDTTLESAGQQFRFGGQAQLSTSWRGQDPVLDAIDEVDLFARGRLEASVLRPFLEGGVASGPLDLDINVSGPPDRLTGRALLSGPDASLLYRSPYLARLTNPEFELTLQDGGVDIVKGRLNLNDGNVHITGRLEKDLIDVWAKLNGSRFRLDYGLLVETAGSLHFVDHGGAPRFSGKVSVDRGYLTRPVSLNLDLLAELLAPIDLTSASDDSLDDIRLDFSIETKTGIRVKNNIADTLIRWEPIRVTGSVLRPVLRGKVEAEPGGRLFLYGQTVRLDQASITYPGRPGVDPKLDLETTSSLQDPTIGRLEGADPFLEQTSTSPSAVALDDVTTGLAHYYGERLTERLSESLGGTEVSLRPVLIFGEADPSARLTVSRDFSPAASLAASVDLRDAERQTYLLDLHELARAPGFNGQFFTNDESTYGMTLLQRREFGATKEDTGDRIKVRKLVLPKVEGVSKRAIKRALGFRKGDRIDPDSLFGSEVEVGELLRRRGYPDAIVRVRLVEVTAEGARKPRRRELVEIELDVDPGPRVEFVFVDNEVSKKFRDSITSLFRGDLGAGADQEEMREQTVRVLRSRGFLDPEVEIETRAASDPDSKYDLTVRVVSRGGVRVEPTVPQFEGLSPEESEVAAAQFPSPVQRVELSMGLPAADERLLRSLDMLGYPDAKIAARFSSDRGRQLTIRVDPGRRRMIERVEISGATEAAETSRMLEVVELGAGDPLRGDLLAISILALEDLLEREGYLEAQVSAEATPIDGDPYRIALVFRSEKGDLQTVAGIEFEGLDKTKETWANRVVGLEPGDALRRDDLNEGRRGLFRTGLFSDVTADVLPASKESELAAPTTVSFKVSEHPRLRLAYGARWNSDSGFSGVVDATNSNFLGRGLTLGARALYAGDDRSVRGLLRVPQPKGLLGSFELFAVALRRLDSGIITEQLEATLQYTRPLGQRSRFQTYGRIRDTRFSEEVPDPFFPLDERIKSPLVGFQYVFDSRDEDPLHTRGTFASLDLSGSEDFLGSDFRYARAFGQFNLFRGLGRIGGGRLTWGQSYRIGAAEPFGDQELIRDVRFFAGGEYSVRGYERETLGPQEQLGSLVRPIGGAALAVMNQELRWEAFDWLSPVLFMDAGNVYTSTGDLGSDLRVSVGLGLRALTPAGLLRVDLAHALDRRDRDPEFKLYFGLGTTF